MGTVHIGISHDDDLVIAELRDIEILMNSGTERRDHGFDLRISVDPVESRLLHV